VENYNKVYNRFSDDTFLFRRTGEPTKTLADSPNVVEMLLQLQESVGEFGGSSVTIT
jgi:hypothetical protein